MQLECNHRIPSLLISTRNSPQLARPEKNCLWSLRDLLKCVLVFQTKFHNLNNTSELTVVRRTSCPGWLMHVLLRFLKGGVVGKGTEG